MPKNKSGNRKTSIHARYSSFSYSLIDLITHHVLDNIKDSVYWINTDGYFNFMNKTMLERRGISPKQCHEVHYLDLIDPEYHALAKKNFQRVIGGEDGIPQELKYALPDGQIQFVETQSRPIWEQGKVVGLLGISRNITKRKEIEQDLQKSEERYRTLLKNAPDAILLADVQGNLLELNQKAEQLLGYTKSELLCLRVPDIHPKEQIDRIRNTFQEIVKNGFAMIYDTLALRKDGSTVPIEITASRVEYYGGIVIQGIFRDLTERKQAEKQSWVNQERLRLALQAGRHGFFDWEVTSDRLYISDQLLEISGYGRDELEPRIRSWKERLHPLEKAEVLHALKKHLDGATGRLDVTHRLKVKSGAWRWFRGLAEVVERDDTGRALRMMGTITDVTPYKEFEEELERKVEDRTAELVEVNSALKVLLRQREHDKAETEETMAANLKFMVFPYLNKLKKSVLDVRQREWVSLVDENLAKVSSPFIKKLSSRYTALTPRELQIAELIKSGSTSKEIAEVLNINSRTVDLVRYLIRRKLGLTRKRANLQSSLNSIT